LPFRRFAKVVSIEAVVCVDVVCVEGTA